MRMAVGALALTGGAGVLWLLAAQGGTAPDSPAGLARGAAVYAQSCASCHGAALQGAPDWTAPGPDGLMPAPPHDATGHTWHHSDRILFRIVAEGPASVVGGGYRSAMPGFGDVLSDADIRAVLAHIRSTWPERQRTYQAEMTARDGGG